LLRFGTNPLLHGRDGRPSPSKLFLRRGDFAGFLRPLLRRGVDLLPAGVEVFARLAKLTVALREFPAALREPRFQLAEGGPLCRRLLHFFRERRLAPVQRRLGAPQLFHASPQGGLLQRELLLLRLRAGQQAMRLAPFGSGPRLPSVQFLAHGGLACLPLLLRRCERLLTFREVDLQGRKGLFPLRQGRLRRGRSPDRRALGVVSRVPLRGDEGSRGRLSASSRRPPTPPGLPPVRLAAFRLPLRDLSALARPSERLPFGPRFQRVTHRALSSPHRAVSGRVRVPSSHL